MAEEQTPPQETPPTRKSPMKLILIAVVALVLIGGAAGAVLMLRGGEAEPVEEVEVETIPTFGPIVELEDFTVNLDDASGQRYLRVKINLELDDESLRADIEDRKPVIRDTILLLLTGLQLDDISSVQGKEELKETIRTRIEQFLRPGAIRRVLFVEFLVQ